MVKFIKNSIETSLKNWQTLILFVIGYKIFSYSILYSITSDLLSMILKTTGESYLSAENLYLIFINPFALLLSIIMLISIVFFVFIELIGLVIYSEAGWQGEKISILELLKCIVFHFKKILKKENFLLIVFFLVTSIVTFLPYSPYALEWLRIPEFVLDFIKQNPLLFPIYIILTIIINITLFSILYSIPYILFKNKTVKETFREIIKILKKKNFKLFSKILVAIGIFGIFAITLSSIIILLFIIFAKINNSAADAFSSFYFYYQRIIPVIVLIITSFGTIYFFSLIIDLYHESNNEQKPEQKKESIGTLSKIKKIIILLIFMIVITIFGESELGGSIIHITYSNPEIVAHRGGAAFAPENTLSAIRTSISAKADMVEIDVQQLKDGTLILLHDDSFYRTTGNNKKVWEVDYAEVKTYDAGSWFSSEFAREPIPTLDDALKIAKDKIKVMIELKLTGKEDNLVKNVIELIEKHNMISETSIGSLNLEVLREVRDLNSKINTIYITPLIYSGQYNIEFIDGFSVETTSLNLEMVATMHLQGKKVYGWTASSEDTIKKNLGLQVDGIVTDNPKLVKFYLKSVGNNLILDFIEKTFFK